MFYGPVLGPIVLSINPDHGYNDQRVTVRITGTNFRNITGVTTVELRLTGQPTITATAVSVIGSTTIECRLDLRGASPEVWSVYVDNESLGPGSTVLTFTIRQAELEIVGPALNYPNPFNPDKETTDLRYILTQDGGIVVNLYNIAGERILSRKFPPGTNGGRRGQNDVIWNGRDVFELSVPNGVYVCQIATEKGKTLALVKIAVLR
jgi:hypothetical protein